jgi:hypothetical protein
MQMTPLQAREFRVARESAAAAPGRAAFSRGLINAFKHPSKGMSTPGDTLGVFTHSSLAQLRADIYNL